MIYQELFTLDDTTENFVQDSKSICAKALDNSVTEFTVCESTKLEDYCPSISSRTACVILRHWLDYCFLGPFQDFGFMLELQ